MERQASKRRRIRSFEPNNVLRAVFLQKYLNYLLPALLEIESKRPQDRNEDHKIEKIVRFEVDMALVLSANMFRWSRALKHKIERDMYINNLCTTTPHQPTSLNLLLSYKQNGSFITIRKANDISSMPSLQRTLVPIGLNQNPNQYKLKSGKLKQPKRVQYKRRTKKATKGGDKEQLSSQVRTLRMLLPGGNKMGVHELLSEVESYVICLEMQVSVLKSLVGTH